MKKSSLPASLFLACAVSTAHGGALPDSQKANAWFGEGEARVDAKSADPVIGSAKNVILFVGDGMGITTLTASRIREGQLNGSTEGGEEHYLSFEQFPNTALVKVYNVNAQVPDSAGTMTAMMTGVKTDVGVIGVDEDIERGDCSTLAGNELRTALELAEIKGMSTGIVATARITHATPAATYAKSPDRNWEDNSDLPDGAAAAGCMDIASQLINFEDHLEAAIPGVDVDGIDVIMGGGRRHFLPNDAAFNVEDVAPDVEGDRTDGRDLTAEWQEKYPEGVYITDSAGFATVNPQVDTRILALFNESHMQYEQDRLNDRAGEPSLTEMVTAAVQALSTNDRGFFLMVESGRIDHAHHAGNAEGALQDTIEMAEAVAAADALTDDSDTLILVTADHSHVLALNGYAQRGNDILGLLKPVGSDDPALASDGLPYTVLTYNNGNGFHDLGSETDSDASYGEAIHLTGRVDLTSVDTTAPGFHQEALIPLSSETHSGEDITIHAKGAGANLVQGVLEQNAVYHIMNQALGLID